MKSHTVGVVAEIIRNTHSSPQPFRDGRQAAVQIRGLCLNIEIKALYFGGVSSGLKQVYKYHNIHWKYWKGSEEFQILGQENYTTRKIK